jgi:hypothetical protein
MQHPEGRIIAIQEQIHLAELASKNFDMASVYLLACLSKSGMRLVADENEIAVDAANLLQTIMNDKPLRAVKNDNASQN